MKEQLDQMREDMARGLAEERDRNEQLLLRVKAHHVVSFPVLQRVAVSCRELQCAAVCCSVLQ